MMDHAPGTLFERLVARTVEPVSDIAIPLPPVFDTWGEAADESVSSTSDPSTEPTAERIVSPRSFKTEEALEPPSRPAFRARAGADVSRSHESLLPPSAPPMGERQLRTENLAAPQWVEATPPEAVRDERHAEKGRLNAASLSTITAREVDRDRPASDGRHTPLWRALASHAESGPPEMVEPAPGVRSRPDDRLTAITVLPLVEPNLPPMIPEPSRAAAVTHAAPPETIIHVTIGRLEIRSGEQARPAKPAERAVVPSSLEEYLAKRQGSAS